MDTDFTKKFKLMRHILFFGVLQNRLRCMWARITGNPGMHL